MTDITVIGGGASGLISAITASRNGKTVTILEKNNNCGKKILVTGNGKCNYYNKDQNLKHYHSQEKNLEPIINPTNMNTTLKVLQSIGIIPNIKNGYYYPYSNQAISVLNCLLIECQRLGVKIITETKVHKVIKKENNFEILTNKNTYYSHKVILAMGSYAYYNKEEVNGYEIAEQLGHTIIKPRPALVQLLSNFRGLKKISGVRNKVQITLYSNNHKIREEEGELLFTPYGISGICAMQLSREVGIRLDNSENLEVVINLVYDICKNTNTLIDFLNTYTKTVINRSIKETLDNILNYKLVNLILDKTKIDGNQKWNNLTKEEKNKLANWLINFKMPINGTRSFKEAQVCSGGVDIREINMKTMESKIVKNLYLIGELVDVDGDCGGYNLTFAWTSGILGGGSSSND